MDGLCFISRCLFHPLCRTSRGRTQKNRLSESVKIADNRPDCGCFSGSGTSCQNKKAIGDCADYGIRLDLIKRDFFFFLNLLNFGNHSSFLFQTYSVTVKCFPELAKTIRTEIFSLIKRVQENFLFLFDDNFLFDAERYEPFFDTLHRLL